MRAVIGSEMSRGLCIEVGKKTQFVFHLVVFLLLIEEAEFTF